MFTAGQLNLSKLLQDSNKMKNLKKNMPVVLRRFKKSENVLLISDFDGTLSPIAEKPEKALLPAKAKNILKNWSSVGPVAIVSGRSLRDVKAKVGIKNLIYAGNHGAEWQIDGKYDSLKFDPRIKKLIAAAKKEFKALVKKYPKSLIEDKKIAFSAHYRLLPTKKGRKFLKEAVELAKKYEKTGLISYSFGKKVIDIKPKTVVNKGVFCRFLLNHLEKETGKKFEVMYLGDDVTDEDAFKEFKSGITVFVGPKKKSFANYSIKNPTEVIDFLEESCKIIVEVKK
jgi:alpha,alpha-trehalase